MLLLYGGFVALVLLLLALDLGVFHRTAHVVGVREALGWSAFWASLGLAFTAFVFWAYETHLLGLGLSAGAVVDDGSSAAIKYVTGWLVEKSLAVDNIFVIAMIFGSFAVPAKYQHRVLFWGITGALVMRGGMIAAGSALLREFAWIIWVFGGFLVLTGAKMLFVGEKASDPGANPVVRLVRRILPIAEGDHGERFFVRTGKLAATPLFLALVMVEVTDLVFAVDSIPAVFAITTDPFLVFTSNVFAILGLRSLYFALAGMLDTFHHLKTALSFVLILVGIKMVAHEPIKAVLGGSFHFVVLGLVVAILAAGVAASLLTRKRTGAVAGA
jgi:tellurite resistance protein TerC